MLEVVNINKSFNNKNVLKDITFQINDGEVLGIIGKNGAGKTTLMNIISQVITADSGKVIINGKVINTMNELAGTLGYILDIPASFEYLTAYEYLDFLMSARNNIKEEKNNRINEVLNLVNLANDKNKKIHSFSRGMKQRLGIAGGLIIDPAIIIMDEPSSALDPEGRKEVLEIIEHLRTKGKSIMLSTHILNDVERVCDKIAILVNGEIKVIGETNQILSKYSNDLIIIECTKDDSLNIKKSLEKCASVLKVNELQVGLEVFYKEGSSQDIFIIASKVGKNVSSISIKRMNLEEIFMIESGIKEEKLNA